MDDSRIKALVQAVEPWMVATRRALHQIPELGFDIPETSACVAERLTELGIPFVTERNWIVGLIKGETEGPTVALRADMDALPLAENPGPYSSRHPGAMHACGHDAHMAILLGAAKVLSENRGELAGNVKLLFQPAEETTGGARPMVEAGCMENPHVDWAFGLHVMPTLPVGTIETSLGALNASTDDLSITVHGKSGHCGHPETSVDAIVCAAHLMTALQSLISRNTSPLQPAVIHFGTIHGGTAPNIVCDQVTMTGTLRTANRALRAHLKKRIREVAGGIGQAMGCGVTIEAVPDYAALINHKDEARLVMRLAERMYGAHSVVEADGPSMGAEDFSYMIEKTPGAFFHVGCADPSHMPAMPLHSRAFSLDERCLVVGAAMEVALVHELIGAHHQNTEERA